MKIVLAGQLNHDNMGDALMALIYAKTILTEGHDVFLCEASEVMHKRLADEGLTLSNVGRSFNKSDIDLCVFIGGGYFGQPDITWFRWQMNFMRRKYFQDIATNCIQKDIPYVVCGVEIGPLTGPFMRRIVRGILANAQYVVARNEESRIFSAKNLGIKTSKLSDVVLGNVPPVISEGSARKKYELGIHLTQKLLRKNILSARIWNTLEAWIRNHDIRRVVLVRDQELPGGEKSRVTELVNFILRSKNGIVCDFVDFARISQLLETLSRTKILVTTKLHCGVTAYGYGNQAICIGSHPKIIRFYRDIGMEENYLNYYWFSKRHFWESCDKIYRLFKSNDGILKRQREESLANLVGLKQYIQTLSGINPS
ncbi:MAG: polysaccharide pyruvyl transferase family protein [Syntrophaceae bacterium]|nr:polysaccharide pyruvyl transferase family protein [Syntrophaceae bacterium]